MKKKTRFVFYSGSRRLLKSMLVLTLAGAPLQWACAQITLKMGKTTVGKVVRSIQSQMDYKFFYDDAVASLPVKGINVQNASLRSVLSSLLQDKDVNFTIEDKFVYLKLRESSVAPKRQTRQIGKTRKFSGTVLDENGEPVIGASVVDKVTKVGTVTDMDGNFMLDVAEGTELTISYVGYFDRKVRASQNMNVQLKAGTQLLNDVVVVGYGSQKKVNVTGSISSVSGKDIVRSPMANLTNSIGGKLAGLRVVQRSGEPGNDGGNIDIRGYGTALVIVDGMPSSFDQIDPNEIENITILKDASAAVYGIRAANGVILVTTKRGGLQTTKIELNTTFSWQRPTKYPNLCNAAQFAELTDEDLVNRGKQPTFGREELEKWRAGGSGYESTDWYDEVVRPWAPQQQYNLNMRGGSEKIRYFASLGYLDEGGMWRTNCTNYKRFNFRANTDIQVSKALSASLSLSGQKGERHASPWDPNYIMASIQQTYPTFSPYANHNPDYYGKTNMAARNAKAVIDNGVMGYDKTNNKRFEGMASLTYAFQNVKGLSVKGQFYYRNIDNYRNLFQKKYNYYSYDKAADRYNVTYTGFNPSKLTRSTWNDETYMLQASMNYENTFAKLHHVKGLLLMETTKAKYHSLSGYREFAIDAIPELDNGNDKNKDNSGGSSESGRVGYVGRVDYDYAGKYLVEFSFRYDGSSKFEKSKRWGFFPSVSAGWRISEEPFMKKFSKALDNLKIRASWGRLGDDESVAGYQYLAGYTYPSSSYIFGSDVIKTLVPKGLANKNITWYTSDIYNVGLDADLWHGKLSGTVELFYRRRKGLLTTRAASLPTTFGASLPQENLNSDSNRGFEVQLSHHNKIGEVNYDIAGNFSFSRAKYGHVERNASLNDNDNWRNNTSFRYKNIWWGYKDIGQFQSTEDIANSPVQDGNGNLTLVPGDIKYEDYNHDGVIDDNDIHPIGRGTTPEIMYGLTFAAQWKGLDCTVFFQGAGNFNAYLSDDTANPLFNGANTLTAFMNRWHHEDIYDTSTPWIPGKYPSTYASGKQNNQKVSTFWLQDASYLRLKELQIGYTLPKAWLQHIGLESVRVFFSGYNLLTFTGMELLDPESTGGKGRYYPQQKIISFGLNIKL